MQKRSRIITPFSPAAKFTTMFTPTSKQWKRILRLTPVVLGTLLLLTLVDSILAVTYAAQLYDAPLDESNPEYPQAKHWSIA